MRYFIIFITLRYFIIPCSTFDVVTNCIQSENLSKNLIKVIDNIFVEKSSVASIISSSEASEIMEMTARKINKLQKVSILLESSSKIKANVLRSWSVILIDSLESFMEIYEKISPNKFRFNGYYTIVCTQFNTDCGIQEVFKLLWKKQMWKIVFVSMNNSKFKAQSFNPFRNGNCNDFSPFSVQTSKKNVNSFKTKLTDLKKCPIKVTTFYMAPFVMLKKQELVGRDADLMKTLSQVLNFKLEIELMNGTIPWGYLNANGTGTGAISKLLNNETDLIIGDYFLKSDRKKFFDNSDPYFESHLIFVVPVAEKLSSFEKLFQPFELEVWILFFGFCTAGIFVILIVNQISKKTRQIVFGFNVHSPISNMLQIVLGHSQPILPDKTFARFILMLFVMFNLVMRSIYQGSLYRFLQSEESHKQVKSLEELYERNFKFYIGQSFQDLIPEASMMFER